MEAPLRQVLLQHGQFVRNLARSLLSDPHLSEDAAQEVWLRYLEETPTDRGSLRGWLRRVVFNLSANLRRGERHRRARQQDAACAAALPSAAEEAEHGELLRRMIEAALALEEPYRSTILERYFHGRDAREIASATGTPLATVRSREQRALERLRARLDREFGERGAWAAGLALLRPEPVGIGTGAAAGTTLAIGGTALAFVVAGMVWRAFVSRDAEESPLDTAAQVVDASPSEAGGTITPPRSESQDRQPVRERSRTGAAGGQGTSLDSLAEIRGRFLLAGGTPAAGTRFEIEGWKGNQERVLEFGEPDDWVDPTGSTDEDGRFSIRFDPPRAYQFTFEAKTPGYAGAEWRWGEILPGSVLDLGEVQLPRGATIEGRIVDPQGRLQPGQKWLVYAASIGLGRHEGRDETQVIAPVDPETGVFRAEDVWPGLTSLKAYSRVAKWLEGPRVLAISGETITADIVYGGPDNSRRITVTTFCALFHVMNAPAPEHIRLHGAGEDPLLARKIAGSSQSFSFDELEPGKYTIEIDDPRYEPWSSQGVEPGTEVSARLTGSSALLLHVLDAENQPSERFELRVTFRNVNFWPREFEVHDGSDGLRDRLFAGLFPGDYTLEARCEDGRSGFVEVDSLAAGETRPVTIRLASTASVSGRVLHPDGQPVAGVEILLLVPAEEGDSDASPVLRSNASSSDETRSRRELDAAATDDAGRFRFALPAPGRYLVMAVASGGRRVSSPILEVQSGEELVNDDIVLARGGLVRGRIRVPEGASCAGLRVEVRPASRDLVDLFLGGPEAVELGPDGAFEIGPLRAGTATVSLLLPEVRLVHDQLIYTRVPEGPGARLELGTLEVPSDGALEVFHDIGERFPGSIRVRVDVNGTARAGLHVRLLALDGTGGSETRGSTKPTGESDPIPVFPGTYRIEVHDPEQGWTHLQGAIAIATGAELSLAVSVQVTSGVLELIDARTGQPAANRNVSVSEDDGKSQLNWLTGVRSTDERGRLELTLTPGSYRLILDPPDLFELGRFPADDEPRAATIQWTIYGPADPRVEL